ncbi:MFS transporter [Francisella halioticida]|uniref:MFS transporter n=1 Tax=Francisella halioticida TaxID=549298 RepID=A0ABM6M163_9GAMM|nr:MFS transporter [Francisella halioticida]ASG68725.1 MFS transporter [Francisella halioticida]
MNLNFRYSFKYILTVYILAAILGGYALAIVGGIGEEIRRSFHLNTHQLSILLGLVFLGGVLAKIIWLATDYIGRKFMILIFVVFYIIGTYIFVIAQGYETLIVARLIQGGSILLGSYAFPIYITEISPADRRGRYVALFQLLWTAGMCLSGVLIFLFYDVLDWSEYFYITLTIGVVLLIASSFLPSSPTWLVLKNRIDAAYNVIKKTQPNLTDTEIKKHIEDIKISLRIHAPRSFVNKLLIGKDIWPVVIVTVVLILNQLTGINFIVFSSELIIAPLTSSSYVAHTANFLILAVNFVVTILTIFVIDKWGRKKVIYMGLTVGLASMLGLVILYSLPNFAYNYVLVIILLTICIAGLAFGPSGVIVTLINELLPNRVRIIGIFMAGVVSMLFSFYFIGYFLKIGQNWGFNVMFGLLLISSCIYFWVVKKFVPETAGKTLEEIENKFE